MDTTRNYQQDTHISPQLPHAFYCCTFSVEHYNDSQFSLHGVSFPEKLKNAVAKRRAEFLAGRICAKHTLEKAGVRNFPLLSGEDRAPIWPSHITGSITHTRHIAMAVTTSNSDVLGIGIDIERLMDAEQEQKLKSQILHPAESAIFSRLNEHTNHPLTLIFSAKESIFKALYPSVGKFFGFEAAKLVTFTANELEFSITETLSETVPQHTVVKVLYQTTSEFVFTECEFRVYR
ncbi:4'-phosphopantetheinyl transferase family protein [Pseudoalteromonas aurantia]|uniref:Enterobactin synthase component D n=1 Tax=Pseudoalteromonas aurantia 208 TaxID=1314867 RepID=A0ABR9E6E2_9GAMM|nr:4'-phosphopantetheinyl transferase superfamily protein [Pseudoalteromonas aurantia]MBE0366556.1 enterobactin synthetase component D [Pseudoalteromonas aurantia 208]